ncbi:hypothetical protein IRJ41_008422 [Triplophysa rosa]|uniref:Uncharacterized protein n=1 Tax=Triplophysa rosa TaxID=992332 RepID=A0A9W7TLH9_TRIRA|nr:hypothetical protein IRJ41_008422 [Triplophysa rosa]
MIPSYESQTRNICLDFSLMPFWIFYEREEQKCFSRSPDPKRCFICFRLMDSFLVDVTDICWERMMWSLTLIW